MMLSYNEKAIIFIHLFILSLYTLCITIMFAVEIRFSNASIPSLYGNVCLSQNIIQNGIFSAVPYIGYLFAQLLSGQLADFLRRKSVPTVVVRKAFTTLGITDNITEYHMFESLRDKDINFVCEQNTLIRLIKLL